MISLSSFPIYAAMDVVKKEDLNKKIEDSLDPIKRSEDETARKLQASEISNEPPPPKCEVVGKYIVKTESDGESNGEHIHVYLADGEGVTESRCLKPGWKLVLHVPDKYQIYQMIKNDLLFLDSGTGTGERGMIIYDLKTAKKMFDGSSRDDCGKGFVSDDEFEYCLTEKASVGCTTQEIASSKERGLEAVTGRLYRLDLKTFTVTKTKMTSCQEDQ